MTWLDAVDDSYRREFRELFDANFGQVRAEMAQLRAEMRGEMAQLRAEIRGEMSRLRDELTVRLKSQELRLIRWMVGLWLSSMLALAAFMWSRIT